MRRQFEGRVRHGPQNDDGIPVGPVMVAVMGERLQLADEARVARGLAHEIPRLRPARGDGRLHRREVARAGRQ